MTSSEFALVKHYGSNHPESFAQVLELHLPEETAEFLEAHVSELPDGLIERLLPHYISRVCEHLEPVTIATLLSATDSSFLAAVLRSIHKNKRNSILGYLSAPRRAACQLLLNFPIDAVGSWMNSSVITLPSDTTVASAKKLIESAYDNAVFVGSDRIFVVSRDRFLIGYISHLALNRAAKNQDFSSLIERNTNSIPSRMMISTALKNDSWAYVDTLPVINSNLSFVGIIRHVDLRMAIEQNKRTPELQNEDNALDSLAEAYSSTYLALFNTFEELLVDKEKKWRN